MSRRKTYTSWEVKERYNAKHYERVSFRVGVGGKEALRQLAGNLSVNAYLQALVVKDGRERGFADISLKIGGGGLNEYWTSRILKDAARGHFEIPAAAYDPD